MKTLTFTGHRCSYFYNIYDIGDEFYKPIIRAITNKIEYYITEKNCTEFISGGALGVDMISFFCVHKLKVKYPNIKNILALPYATQGSNWSLKDKQWLETMKRLSDDVRVVDTLEKYKIGKPGTYNPKKLQMRNQYMVDNSDFILALWSGEKSGTKNCIDYALNVGKTVNYIYLNKGEKNMKIQEIKHEEGIREVLTDINQIFDKKRNNVNLDKKELCKKMEDLRIMFEEIGKAEVSWDKENPLDKILSEAYEVESIDAVNNCIELKELDGTKVIIVNI